MTTDRRTFGSALLGTLLVGPFGRAAVAADDEAAVWAALRQGDAAGLMRHALAPGVGDPAGFQIDECATQRNLSDEGRAQARAIGERFRTNGVDRAEVRSSQWCRCLETAELLQLGPVVPMPALNSFFRDRSSRPEQTRAVRQALLDWPGDRPLVLVTHQVNISALTGRGATSGEIVAVAPGGRDQIRVVGSIRTETPG